MTVSEYIEKHRDDVSEARRLTSEIENLKLKLDKLKEILKNDLTPEMCPLRMEGYEAKSVKGRTTISYDFSSVEDEELLKFVDEHRTIKVGNPTYSLKIDPFGYLLDKEA